MVFSTDSELFYIKLHYKSEKVHGTFSWDYKNQGHTVCHYRYAAKIILSHYFCDSLSLSDVIYE